VEGARRQLPLNMSPKVIYNNLCPLTDIPNICHISATVTATGIPLSIFHGRKFTAIKHINSSTFKLSSLCVNTAQFYKWIKSNRSLYLQINNNTQKQGNVKVRLIN
jgi:hypothetical protein